MSEVSPSRKNEVQEIVRRLNSGELDDIVFDVVFTRGAALGCVFPDVPWDPDLQKPHHLDQIIEEYKTLNERMCEHGYWKIDPPENCTHCQEAVGGCPLCQK